MALKKEVIDKEMENRGVFKSPSAPSPSETPRKINPLTKSGRPRKTGSKGGIMGQPNGLKYDDFIKVMIGKSDKITLEEHCKRIGTDISSKVRELIFKYMDSQGLR